MIIDMGALAHYNEASKMFKAGDQVRVTNYYGDTSAAIVGLEGTVTEYLESDIYVSVQLPISWEWEAPEFIWGLSPSEIELT